VYTHDALAWVLFRLGRLDEAAKASEIALSRGTPEPLFHFHAAMIDDARGRKNEAAQELSKAMALNPEWDFEQCALARKITQSATSLSSSSHVKVLESHLKGLTE